MVVEVAVLWHLNNSEQAQVPNENCSTIRRGYDKGFARLGL